MLQLDRIKLALQQIGADIGLLQSAASQTYAQIRAEDGHDLNVNIDPLLPVPMGGVSDYLVGDCERQGSDGIKCNFDGIVRVNALVQFTATVLRVAPAIAISGGNANPLVMGRTGYVRLFSGHNSATLHINNYFVTVSDGDVIGLKSGRRGNAGVCAVTGEASYLSIERMV